MNVRKTITTSALALGVLAGSAGIASAVSSQGSTVQPEPSEVADDDTQDPTLNGSVQAIDVDGQSEADESAGLASLASMSADDAGQAAGAQTRVPRSLEILAC